MSEMPRNPELDAFRRKAAFVRSPTFREVAFLKPGQKPNLMQDDDGLPWDAADWVAQEADGSAIGLLKLPGVSAPPVVLLDDEGQLRVSGLSLVDHFALSTGAGALGPLDLEPLLEFCRKTGLPGPRTQAQVSRVVENFKLDRLDRLEGKPPQVAPKLWKKELDAAAPQKVAPAAPKPKTAKGKTVRPYGNASTCPGLDGRQWFASYRPGAKKSTLMRFTGSGFERIAELPLCVSSMARHGDSIFVSGWGVVMRWADGVQQQIKIKSGMTLYGGKHLYAVEPPLQVSRWDGGRFRPISLGKELRYATHALAPDGSLVIFGKDSEKDAALPVLLRVEGDDVQVLPRCPDKYTSLVGFLDEDRVLVSVGDSSYWFPLSAGKKGKWVEAKNFPRFWTLTRAANGETYGVVAKQLEVHRVEGAKVVPAGKLALKPRFPCAAAVDDDIVVFFGGELHVDSDRAPPCEAQLWSTKTGEARAAGGWEAELEAQKKIQSQE